MNISEHFQSGGDDFLRDGGRDVGSECGELRHGGRKWRWRCLTCDLDTDQLISRIWVGAKAGL